MFSPSSHTGLFPHEHGGNTGDRPMMIDASALKMNYGDQPSMLVVSAPGAHLAASQAGTLADLRVVGVTDFANAAATLADRAGPDLIAIEMVNADPATVEAALLAIDALAHSRDIDIVVSLGAADIDMVAGHVFGRRVQLLCDASVADRVAAYRLAGRVRDARLHDHARDADARLERLNAEVARFADTLARLAAENDRARPSGQVRDSMIAFGGDVDAPVAVIEPAAVRDAIRARRMRAAYFAEDLFADPAWDMLLDLFAAELENRRVSVSSLCIAAAVPGTTALRWIGSMVEAGLFVRDADARDRRRAFIALSPGSRQGMQRYFTAIRRAGLGFA